MRPGRSVPPAATPIFAKDLYRGITGLIQGGHSEKLEGEIREFFGCRHVFPVSSGKAALALILEGFSSLRNRKKVIIPGYICYSVPSAVRKSGLEIIPCDLRPDTLDFDYSRLEKLVDDETLCILSAHLFGIPGDMDRIRRIAGERNIFLVEDAAQAMGVVYGGRKLGSIGDVGFFSLGRGKQITCGSGGIIITCSEEIAAAISSPFDRLDRGSLQESAGTLLELFMMKVFMNSYLYWLPDGLPFLKIGETRFFENFPVSKMNDAKSGALYYWKEKLECMNNIRRKVSDEYKDRLGIKRDIGIYSFDIPYLRFPVYMKDEEHKRRLCDEYRHYGVSPMYPCSVDSIAEIKESVAGYAAPLSARIAKTMVTLPTHNLVDETSRDRICDAVIAAMRPDFRNV